LFDGELVILELEGHDEGQREALADQESEEDHYVGLGRGKRVSVLD
jgi:hypothetical protein